MQNQTPVEKDGDHTLESIFFIIFCAVIFSIGRWTASIPDNSDDFTFATSTSDNIGQTASYTCSNGQSYTYLLNGTSTLTSTSYIYGESYYYMFDSLDSAIKGCKLDIQAVIKEKSDFKTWCATQINPSFAVYEYCKNGDYKGIYQDESN